MLRERLDEPTPRRTRERFDAPIVFKFNKDQMVRAKRKQNEDKWSSGVSILTRIPCAPQVLYKVKFRDGHEMYLTEDRIKP